MKLWKRYSEHTTKKSAQQMLKLLKESTTKTILGYKIEREDTIWCLWLREL